MYLRLIHVDIRQKPTQHCRGIILQLKTNNFFLKNIPLPTPEKRRKQSKVKLALLFDATSRRILHYCKRSGKYISDEMCRVTTDVEMHTVSKRDSKRSRKHRETRQVEKTRTEKTERQGEEWI